MKTQENSIFDSFWSLSVNFSPNKNSSRNSRYPRFSCGPTNGQMAKHVSQDIPCQGSKNLNQFDMLEDTMYELPTHASECLRSGNQIMLASYFGLCLHANKIIRASTIYSCAICKQVKHAFYNHQVPNYFKKI